MSTDVGSIGTTEAPFAVADLAPGEDVELRIFIDKYLIELFANGRQAVVTGLNESNPCRPKVQLLVPADADGAEGSACVDLARAGSPAIARIQERAVDASCFYRLAPKPPQFAVLVPADEVGACE